MSKSLSIVEMQEIAEKRGGKCLSETYVGAHSKLLWECKEKHQWEAKPNSVKNGTWCLECSGSAKGTIKKMKKIAQSHGGKCLSNNYVNNKTKLLWECSEGHHWEAIPNSVTVGKWCLKCSNKLTGISRRLSIVGMQAIAKQRGGKCLSKSYINSRTKLLWECTNWHKFEATPGSVKRGSWCRKCSYTLRGMSRRLGIEEMQKIAKQRGGKCLSVTYVDANTKLLWECAERHKWKTIPNEINRGKWCPECSSGLGERICREFFVQIFGMKFPKSYPTWLRNKRGNQMELDGFCQSLGIAFEHHGEQHYSTKSMFIKSEKVLQERQMDDRLKRKLCKQQKIVLIEVPEIPTRISIGRIKAFIKKECIDNSVPLPSDYDTKKIDFKKAYATSVSRATLEEMHKIASERGGECISDIYANRDIKLLWECKEEHRWLAKTSAIKRGTWCPECGGNTKKSINEMQEIAKVRGGKCLSELYINNKTSLLWECSEGHQWKAKPNGVKNGTWCPKCAGNVKGTILEMRRTAEERGGKCLSDTYVNANTNLLWECKEKHQWKSQPVHIKNGSWCPKCSHKRRGELQRLSIDMMIALAKQRGGRCLSDTYQNNHAKLLWECSERHQWKATPAHIKNGSWCPHCAGVIKGNIEEMKRIAYEREGQCLSESYVNNRKKLLWKCKEGHRWQARPHDVKMGTWCPKCANKQRSMS